MPLEPPLFWNGLKLLVGRPVSAAAQEAIEPYVKHFDPNFLLIMTLKLNNLDHKSGFYYFLSAHIDFGLLDGGKVSATRVRLYGSTPIPQF